MVVYENATCPTRVCARAYVSARVSTRVWD